MMGHMGYSYQAQREPRYVGPLPERSWETPLPNNTGKGEDETLDAFAAFCIYRDMPPALRSIRGAAELWAKQQGKGDWVAEITEKGAGRQHHYTSTYSRAAQWRWQDRVRQMMSHYSRVATEAREERIRQMLDRHGGVSKKMVSVADKALDILHEHPKALSPDNVRNFVVDGVRMERLAHGLPEKVEKQDSVQEVTAKVPSNMQTLLEDPRIRDMADLLLEEMCNAEEASTRKETPDE